MKIKKIFKLNESSQSVLRSLALIVMVVIATTLVSMIIVVPSTKADIGDWKLNTAYFGTGMAGNITTAKMYRNYETVYYANSSGSYLFAFGGYDVTTDNHLKNITRTNIETNVTIDVASLSTYKLAVGACYDELNTTVYLLGGGVGGSAYKMTVEAYNISNNTCWVTGATWSMSSGRSGARGVWVNQTCYWLGGYVAGDGKTKDLVCYKPSNNTVWVQDNWSVLTSLIGTGNLVYKGSGYDMYMFGAVSSTSDQYLSQIVGYNYSNRTAWQAGTLLRGPADGYTVYDSVYDRYIMGPSRGNSFKHATNISYFDTTTFTEYVFSNNSYNGTVHIWWHSNLTNKTLVIGPTYLTYYGGAYLQSGLISILYLGYSGTGTTASSYTLVGLANNRIDWSGTAGTTVWNNATGDASETLEINLSINSSDNVTDMRVWVGNLNDTVSWANASNISVVFSSDNSTWSVGVFQNFTTFTDGGSNVTINSSQWTQANGFYGTSPFTYGGLTNTNRSVFCRFKLTIPATAGSYNYYNSTTWYVYIGRYT